MPHLNLEFFNDLKGFTQDFLSIYSTFVETGTYRGMTAFAMEPYFKTIHTIEIDNELYYSTKSRYSGNKIIFYLGDSSYLLEDICQKINTPTIFFLDGHWSAGDTGKGEKDCPLYDELTQIMNHFRSDAIIIVDDFRLFGKGPSTNTEVCNWEYINKEKVLNIVSSRLVDEYHLPSNLDKYDRLIISIKSL